jgi:hypothetical protein
MAGLPSGLPSRADVAVACDRCGVRVRVGKTSWQQTSVQWPADGPGHCPELSDRPPDDSMLARVRTCGALQRSISKAVLAGGIPIPE